MGKGRRDEAIERVALQVSSNLGEIVNSLELIAERLSPPRHQSERAQLRDVLDRVERCRQLLATELDRPDPDATFLRKAVAAGIVAAQIAVGAVGGFVTSEFSQEYDLRAPIERVEQAGDAASAALDPEQVGEPAVSWRVTSQEGDWARLVTDPNVRVHVRTTWVSDQSGGHVSLSISLGRTYEDPTASLAVEGRMPGGEPGSAEVEGLVWDALEWIGGAGGLRARGLVNAQGRRQSLARGKVVVEIG